jgi:putative Ca2+/H+ antiporter (TMEM165/GDT1 family)
MEALLVSIVVVAVGEIGDKTQIATVVLAAKFNDLVAVIAGTTLGMLIADVPVVYVGRAAAARIPLRAVRVVAAALFAVLAVVALVAP